VTLATRGIWNFDGALARPLDPAAAEALGIQVPAGGVARLDANFTAHPKLDPETGELLAFGYSPIAPTITTRLVSPDGKLVRSVDVDGPYPSMMHDFVATRERLILPVFPATFRIERLAEGRSFLCWEPELGTRIGVMRRDGGSGDVVWFEADPCYVFHFWNAFDDGDRVMIDAARYDSVPIPADGQPEFFSAVPTFVRFCLDLGSGSVKQEPRDDLPVEFPRLDERRAGLPYRYAFAACARPGSDEAGGYPAVVRYDLASGARCVHDFGPGNVVSEPVFVPRTPDAPEGDGWLLVVVHRGAERRSDLAVLDAARLDAPPLALARLPHRVPAGFHGNWRDLRR
jgi:carotenoid cleavage dioxygenase